MREHLGNFYDKSSDFQQQFLTLCALIDQVLPKRDQIKTLLDIGSGAGARTLQCLDVFPFLQAIVGIEPDKDMIETAQNNYAHERIKYLQMAAADIPRLEDEGIVYDGVISNWVMHWVPDKKKMMEDLNCLTHSGSVFMISTCEDLPSILKMVDVYIRGELRLAEAPSPFFYLTVNEWGALLRDDGWEVLKVQTASLQREVESAKQYLDHWFTASAAKFMYGRHIAELSPLAHKDLLLMMQRAFPSPHFSEGLMFSEDVLFLVARRK